MHPMSLLLPLVLAQAPAPPPVPTHDLFGASVDSAGDVDRDGVPDLWVGDPSLYGPTGRALGKAWCVSGKDGSTLLRIDAPAGAEEFGWTIAGLGDVDADGVRDVAVGCLYVETPGQTSTSRWGEGGSPAGSSAVHVHSGRDGALKYAVRGSAERAKVVWYSTAAGPALAVVGDWNEDGVDDLAIGWSYADGESPDQGRVQVVSGRDGTSLREWLGMEPYDRFGFSLARIPDVDGDGRNDLAAGAVPDRDPQEGAPETKRRTRSGYVRVLSSRGAVVRTLHPQDGSRCFGFSLAAAPRTKPDGADELLVGQPHDWNARFAITRWNLADGDTVQWLKRPELDAWDGGWARKNVHSTPIGVDESFATRLLSVADRDGDGKSDVLATVPQCFCFVPAGVLSSKPSKDARSTPLGHVELGNLGIEYSHIGIGLCATGDLDADQVDDFALSGCSVRCGGGCNGSVVLVSGTSLRVLRAFSRAGRQ
jgi:hypothetical protein